MLKAQRRAAIAVRVPMIAMVGIAMVVVLMTMVSVVRARERPRVDVVMTRTTLRTTLRVGGLVVRVDL